MVRAYFTKVIAELTRSFGLNLNESRAFIARCTRQLQNSLVCVPDIFLLSVCFVLVLGIQSCLKVDSDVNNNADLLINLTGAASHVLGTQITNACNVDVQSVSVEKFDSTSFARHLDGFLKNGSGFGKYSIPHIAYCAIVTVSSNTFPKEIILDYGTGCSDNGTHIKRGKIIINLSDTISNAGAVETIVSKDFYIDGIKVEYSSTLKNGGKMHRVIGLLRVNRRSPLQKVVMYALKPTKKPLNG
jgi:hypothetical protein